MKHKPPLSFGRINIYYEEDISYQEAKQRIKQRTQRGESENQTK